MGEDGMAIDITPRDLPAGNEPQAMEVELPSLEPQARRLQRSISQFRNASVAEQDQLLTAAELSLQQHLEAEEVDGDTICALILRCSGWLHPPIFKENHLETSAAVSWQFSNLQFRLRRLLIRALSNLDLSDVGTRQAIAPAMNFIQALLGKTEGSDGKASKAGRQWRRLAALVACEAQTAAKLQGEDRKVIQKRRTEHGEYCPHYKVIELPNVFQSESIELKCSNCPRGFASNWFWRHPVSGKVHVLVPHKGRKCAKRKKCLWVVQGDVPKKNDRMVELDFCLHNRQKHFCKDCGGSHICPHNSRIYSCSLCKSAGSGKRQQKKC